jgi:serine protease Do
MRFLLLLILALAPVGAAELRAPLTPEERRNGAETLRALAPLRARSAASSVRLVSANGKEAGLATWVQADGYLLAKASEAPDLKQLRARLPDGKRVALREVKRDVANDLLLAHAEGATGMASVAFGDSKHLTFGQWIVSPARDGALRLGVISAERRKIPGMGAAIGVRMEELPAAGRRGVRILGVAEDSPARAAGLAQGDVLLSLAGTEVNNYRQVHELISKRQPGEMLEVGYERAGKPRQARVRLASRTKVLNNWEGEDFANGGISLRTDNFSEVLQHDLPLEPADMGGALYDLDGRAVGLNIARVDRITTFALPAERFWPAVRGWIEADRRPAPAKPATKAPVKTTTAKAGDKANDATAKPAPAKVAP